MIKTGLFFGSFNPVHIGHIALASYMKEFQNLDEIWFIVSPLNPYKNVKNLAAPEARLEMAKVAVKGYEKLIVSDIEFTMPLPSYTIDTLRKIESDYKNRELYIIAGADNIRSIADWKEGARLIEDYYYLIYPRLNSNNKNIELFKNATITNAPLIDISSSFIRRSISEGKNMRAFVPHGVYEYILNKNLYTR